MDKVHATFQSIGQSSPGGASRDRIRRVCRYLGKRNYSERWLQIKLKLGGQPCPKPSEELIADLKRMFAIYAFAAQWLLRNTDRLKPRKTLLPYPYVYIQILRIMDDWNGTHEYERHKWYWQQLKTRSKVQLNDVRWKIVLDKINEDRKFIQNGVDAPLSNRLWHFKPLYRTIHG